MKATIKQIRIVNKQIKILPQNFIVEIVACNAATEVENDSTSATSRATISGWMHGAIQTLSTTLQSITSNTTLAAPREVRGSDIFFGGGR